MPKILSSKYNGAGDKQNIFEQVWNWFSSLDKFTKYSTITLLIVGILGIVTANKIYDSRQYAATGNIYYVSTTGSDTNIGSSTAPFATIQKAASIVQPGDTVYVGPGTYTTPIYSRISGTSTARIAFVSATKWGAVIAPTVVTSATGNAFWYNEGNYVDIVGFEFTGSNINWSLTTNVRGIAQAGSYGRVINNKVHDINTPTCNNGGTGIDINGYTSTGNDIIDNIVYNTGPALPNICNLNHGIYESDLGGGHISNNIIYNIRGGFGIHCWHASTNATITNNLVFNNNYGGILVGMGDNPYNGVTPPFFNNSIIANNIVINNTGNGTNSFGTGIREFEYNGQHTIGPNNQFLNNIVYGNPGGNMLLIEGNTDSGTIASATNTMFVNYQPDGSGDYHLAPGYPAIGAGTPTGTVPYDLDGYARPQATSYDIGPYVFPLTGATASSYPFPFVLSTSSPTLQPTTLPTPTSTLTPTPISSDTIPPTVNILSPTNNALLTRNTRVTISASSSDDTFVAQVQFLVNGSVICTDSLSPYTCAWSIPAKRGAIYTITAIAKDGSGNKSSTFINVKAQ